MKTVKILLVVLVLSTTALAADRPVHPEDLKFEPFEMKTPKPERFELENGMVVYLLENHELPLVDMTIWFRSGSKYEPAGKEGLASMTAAWARHGGAAGKSRLEIDQELEFLAASLGVNIADEHGQAGLSVLKKDFDRGLELLSDVLRKPEFDPMMMMLIKRSFAQGIMQQNDSPAGVLSRDFPGFVYPGHPYGRVPTLPSLQAITRDDCIAFWQKYLQPNQMILGVAGDLSQAELTEKLTKVFGDWESKEVEYPEIPALERKYEPALQVIARPETQSHIQLAHLCVKRDDPDRTTLDVMNLILGGGSFASRLTEIVRVREGLAYGVYSQITRKVDLGLFFGSVQTKCETTYRALDLIIGEIRRIQDEPVPAEELEAAKASILNGMVFSYAQPFGLVESYVSVEYYGYPRDWIETWEKRIAAVTAEDVQRVAKQYLRPDGLRILVVGDPQKFDEKPDYLPEPKIIGGK